MITSANLTPSGFRKNIEYGVLIDDPEITNRTITDYRSICNSGKTGKIHSKNINKIKNILNQLPTYHEPKIDLFKLTGEVDDIINVNKELITNELSD